MIHQDLFAEIRAGDGGAVRMNAPNMLEQSPSLGGTSLIANAMHHGDCCEATEMRLEAGRRHQRQGLHGHDYPGLCDGAETRPHPRGASAPRGHPLKGGAP